MIVYLIYSFNSLTKRKWYRNHERKIRKVTNVKEFDEAYIPIVRNRSLDLEVGANLTYV